MCILFVEDDPLITLVSEDALQDAGFEVMTADNARAAVKLIKDHPGHFTCMVTDIHMPGGGSGFDVVEHMRHHYPAMPIVVATGRPDSVQSEWRIRHSVTLLSKPYGANLMISTIEHLLRVARANPSMALSPAVGSASATRVAAAGVQRVERPFAPRNLITRLASAIRPSRWIKRTGTPSVCLLSGPVRDREPCLGG